MLDSIGTAMQPPRSEDWGLNRARGWKLVFAWFPKECFLTGKRLWLTNCYQGLRIITGPGDLIEEYYYVDKTEFIIWNLKGNEHGIIR